MHSEHTLQTWLDRILSDVGHPAFYWQLALIGVALTLAWGVNRLIVARVPQSEGALKIGLGGVTRAIFPLTALAGVLLGRALLARWDGGHVNLLDLAVPLLTSLAGIRVAVYMLRKVFATGAWVKAWERAISTAIWVLLALYLTGLLPGLLQAMDDIAFQVGKGRVSLLMIVSGLLSMAVTLLVALWLGRVLEARVMRIDSVNLNFRVVLSKLLNAVLVFVGVLIALSAVGIDLTVLSVFGGALGVGLGFGLQKIASNYVSGFIILLDRSIHLGDTLTVDAHFGEVIQLNTRYMVLKGLDGTEAIIPNETLISSTVINHSYTNRHVRLSSPVQISYASDVERAMAIMVEAAAAQPRVLADPPPKAFLKGFADSGIDMELAFWIADPEQGQAGLRSDINLAIWREFKRQGIEIPFPQREVRILGQG